MTYTFIYIFKVLQNCGQGTKQVQSVHFHRVRINSTDNVSESEITPSLSSVLISFLIPTYEMDLKCQRINKK